MADNKEGQEKTEDPTPKKQEKSREDGQTPRSKDLNTSAVLIASALGLAWFGGMLMDSLQRAMRSSFVLERAIIFDEKMMIIKFVSAFYDVFTSAIPFFGIVLVVALLSPALLGGWIFSMKAVAPKASKMNPIAGLKRMFSAKSLVELAKSIAKVAVVSFVVSVCC